MNCESTYIVKYVWIWGPPNFRAKYGIDTSKINKLGNVKITHIKVNCVVVNLAHYSGNYFSTTVFLSSNGNQKHFATGTRPGQMSPTY